MADALDVQVKGIVQGVGFRPFVYRLAAEHQVKGWVLNATDGVFIHVEAERAQLEAFVEELSANPPAAAQVDEAIVREGSFEGFEGFEIRFSDAGEVERTTLVSPDLATCDDCVRELFDPADRRYRYPFINCTNCGPRFTIIESLPYDRKSTSMKDFPMCPDCASEYADPADRRFHAQPDACFDCGPHVSWRERRGMGGATCSDVTASGAEGGTGAVGVSGAEGGTGASGAGAAGTPVVAGAPAASGTADFGELSWGMTREQSDAIFARASELLCEGRIVAVKGLGGFHLVCDANNAQAVALLRARKRREGKAFAVMLRDVDAARSVCEVGELEEATLTSAKHPIVLLRKRGDAHLARGLADKLPELGVMLPYTPVQHLLMHDFEEAWHRAGLDGEGAGVPMLVMTSGNLHDEPIVTDDRDAFEKLACVADAFLGNDRAIRSRYDDSVVRVVRAGSAGEVVQIVRRARGFAPHPLPFGSREGGEGGAGGAGGSREGGEDGQRGGASVGDDGEEGPDGQRFSLFAAGPEQKNTFTLTREGEAFVSQHIGDMENAETYDAWLDAKARFERLFELKPTLLACDRHPEYLSTKWAREESRTSGLPLVEVQHHHAHIASVLGESGTQGPVCGIAFDGTGYGMDGAIWGGEVLLATQGDFERFAAFSYVPMPGGAAAVKHPLRMAYGVLWAYGLLDHPGAADSLAALGPQAMLCGQMIERGINSPRTSSVGRLFDAASALLGICPEPLYEGEPAILLEAAMTQPDACPENRAAAVACAGGAGECLAGAADAGAVVACAEDAGGAAGSAGAGADFAGADPHADTPYYIDIVRNLAAPDAPAGLASPAAPVPASSRETPAYLLDAAPLFRAMLDDKAAGVPTSLIARRFHEAFVRLIVQVAGLVRGERGTSKVALSGGVFMNRYLVEHAVAALESEGFEVLINKELPPNDGCVSFGQAVVACARKDGHDEGFERDAAG